MNPAPRGTTAGDSHETRTTVATRKRVIDAPAADPWTAVFRIAFWTSGERAGLGQNNSWSYLASRDIIAQLTRLPQ